MPDHPAGGERTKPKDYVQKHLDKSGVKAEDLADSVIANLNDFTEPQLTAMYDHVGHDLAKTLLKAYPASKSIIAAIH
jgi:hypothetical protein